MPVIHRDSDSSFEVVTNDLDEIVRVIGDDSYSIRGQVWTIHDTVSEAKG